ncbi:MlaE family ABC transporter permease [Amycolatopsis methanolica]|uniref:ABC transporter permease n=1 Tax=Amycolatopsis methanolica 239 TaxID=1068978 RepID=A0A076MKN7_AMYME|nr:ABC transporter permease [Amycolatopsis methanolica]AIJ21299.1 hypothetical protein AMETH_1207 [Amycolatopsis methanolica 239]
MGIAPDDRVAPSPALGLGPYDGRASRAIGYVPGVARRPVVEAGGMGQLFAKIVWSAVRHPRGYWSEVFEHLHVTIKRTWLPVSASVFGFLMALSVLAVQFFAMAGAQHLFGPTLFMYSTRTFTVWVNSVVMAGVIGAALTSDVGARKVREELDAMRVMGIDPVRDIAVPRVVALTLIAILLSVPSLLVTAFTMQIGASYVAGIPAADFYQSIFTQVYPIDIVAVVLNSLLVGLLVGTVCCYKGFAATGGAIGLGRAVNQAVVVSLLGVFVLQLTYQALYLGLFPHLGELK